MEKYTLQIVLSCYLLLTVCVLFLSSRHRISFFKALLICILFTPIGGFLTIIFTPHKITVMHYKVETDKETDLSANPKLRLIKTSRF